MSLFSKQKFYCSMCGTQCEMETCGLWQSAVCSRACLEERNWRYTLSVMGKPYYENPVHDCIRKKAREMQRCIIVNDVIYHVFDPQQCGAACRKGAPEFQIEQFMHGGKFYVKAATTETSDARTDR